TSFYTHAAQPGTPAEPFTEVNFTSVTLNWLANGNPGGTEFFVSASTASDFTGDLFHPTAGAVWLTDVSTTVVGLTDGTVYYFEVRARNGDNIVTGFEVLGSTKTLGGVVSKTWTNATGDLNWYTAGNWSPAGAPGLGDAVTIDRSEIVTVSASSPPVSFAGLRMGGSNAPTLNISTGIAAGAGWLEVLSGATFQQNSTQTLSVTSATVFSGGLLTHAANTTARSNVVNVRATGNFDVQAGASIAVRGKGYAGGGFGGVGKGPGGGAVGWGAGGGGHGGRGGNANPTGGGSGAGGVTYGSLIDPTELGSGGGGSNNSGSGGAAGGGAVIISVGGTLTVDGLIEADGLDVTNGSGSGGGAGGTVNLTAATLAGAGTLHADGGAGGPYGGSNNGGGGGGGRIALTQTTCSSTLSINGAGGASGGGAAQAGQTGTWYPYPPSFAAEVKGVSSMTWTWGSVCNADAANYNVLTASNNVNMSGAVALTWTELNLATNTLYGRQVRGVNGPTLFPTSLTPSTSFYTHAAQPGTPAEPFTEVNFTSVTLNWLANGNPGYTEFFVQASTASDFTGDLFHPTAGAVWLTDVSTTVVGLAFDTVYHFQVRARNGDGVLTGYQSLASTRTLNLDYPGCAVTRYVGVGQPNATIQDGVTALPTSLPGHACVVITDVGPFNEQVTVQGFSNDGSSITIFTDPAVGAHAVVSPVSGSTAAFRIANSSVNILAVDVVASQNVPYGVWASSAYVTLSSVSVSTSGNLGIYTAGVRISSWSAISYSSVTVWGAYGIWLEGVTGTTIAFSSASAADLGLYVADSDSNTIRDSWFAQAVSLANGADYNFLSRVRVDGTGLILDCNAGQGNCYGNVIADSFVTSSGDGLAVSGGFGNTVSGSTVVANGEGQGMYFDGDSNQLVNSYVNAAGGEGLIIGGSKNAVSGSTIIATGVSFPALLLQSASSGTVSRSFLLSVLDDGVRLEDSTYNTISQSTMVSDAAGFYGLNVVGSSSNTIMNSYVQGSTAALISGSTGTVIGGTVLIATNTAGSALALAGGSVNLTLATSTLISPSLGRSLALNPGNAGVVTLGSVTFSGAARGIEISTQGALFSLAVDSVTFRGLASGATAIHFLGGTFTSTFTLANFEDAGIGANVSGAALDLASRVTMRAARGPRRGPAYENDPDSLVDWPELLPPGAPAIFAVGLSSIDVQYGIVDADGYVVEASTMANFSGVLYSSATMAQAAQLAPQSLDPNTTYFLRAGALWGAATIYAQTELSTATLTKHVSGTTVYRIDVTSMIVNWLPLALAPPDASSNSAAGYLLEVSTRPDFTPLWTSSQTPNVALSTLTAGSLRGEVTYYYRVGTINSAGAVNYAVAGSTLVPLALGVEMTTHTISLPGVTAMSTTVLITTSTVLTNTGNVKETYWIRAATATAGSPWRVGAVPGSDQLVVWSLVNPTEPATGDFADEDKALETETSCSASAYATGAGTCVQVPVGGTRTLWFKIATPLTTSTISPQDVRIYARAVRDPDPDPNP
ncbi:MAG: hypothetical protein Q8T11_04490, partial [Elusimicrobiota bacterium]|nr:hypothetical protein [Elusimicrobiota bacterium]